MLMKGNILNSLFLKKFIVTTFILNKFILINIFVLIDVNINQSMYYTLDRHYLEIEI